MAGSRGLQVENRMASTRLVVHCEEPRQPRRGFRRRSVSIFVSLTLPRSSWQFKFACYQKCIEYGIVHELNLLGKDLPARVGQFSWRLETPIRRSSRIILILRASLYFYGRTERTTIKRSLNEIRERVTKLFNF